MSSRWDRDRKLGSNRDRDRNFRGGRDFDASRGPPSRSPPPRDRRIIKLNNSGRGTGAAKPIPEPGRNGYRSRSRSRDREVRRTRDGVTSYRNGTRQEDVREDHLLSSHGRREDTRSKEYGVRLEEVAGKDDAEKDDSNGRISSPDTDRIEVGETGEIIEDPPQKKISPVSLPQNSPPLQGKKDRWASDDSSDEGDSDDEGHRQKSDEKSNESSNAHDKELTQNGVSIDGSSPHMMTISPSVQGHESESPEAAVEPTVIEHNPLLQGCRDVDIYEKQHRIAEGTYGVVFQAREKSTGKIFALKQVKMNRRLLANDGFPITAVREINIMLCLKHENIVEVQEMVISKEKAHLRVFMVMEYMEHDLKKVMDKMETNWTISEAKCLLLQLLKAIHFMHEKWYMHRDLKTSNLLYNNKGKLCVCDFGLARKYGEPIREYTTPVVTLYYRSPELLMGARKYSTEIDMWSVGCIFAEILLKKPVFVGKCETSQLNKIFSILGNPTEQRWPKYRDLPGADKFNWKTVKPNLRSMFPASSFAGDVCLSVNGFDLLERMLCLDPKSRISAGEALDHEYFREYPPPRDMHDMPTW